MEIYIYFLIVSSSFLVRMGNVSDKSCTEDQNKHFMPNNVFSSENRAVYEIMWKNMEGPERPQQFLQCC